MSKPEVILWQHLRRQQLDGLRFRRQHPIGPYIADFYCAEIALVIEIDGSSHQGERRERDIDRDAWMTERWLHVLRFRAIDVLGWLDNVVATIQREAKRLRKTPPPPADAGTAPVGDGGG